MKRPHELLMVIALAGLATCAGCGEGADGEAGATGSQRSMVITATAYASTRSQTDSTPYTTAFNEKIGPGDAKKIIAISRDLEAMGLTHNTMVTVEGLPATVRVADRTNKRWRKRIDIYFGNDRQAAKRWGKRQVTITWQQREDEQQANEEE